MLRSALLVIDMLNDFCLPGAPLEVPSTRGVIPSIRREIGKARSAGTPVIYLCNAHDRDDKEFSIWPRHAVEGTEGAKIVTELAPIEGDLLVEKKTYSSFYQTDLDDQLSNLGVTELTLTGCVTNICILYTASDAVLRGYKVTVLRDCVAGLDPADDEFAFRQMENVLRVKVI